MKLTEAGKKIFDSPFHPDRMYPDPRQEYVYEEMGIKHSGITIGQYAAVQALGNPLVAEDVSGAVEQAIALCNQLAEVEG